MQGIKGAKMVKRKENRALTVGLPFLAGSSFIKIRKQAKSR